MPRSVEAIVKPELLIWARRSAGFGIEEAAKKIQIKSERLSSWEDGTARPTMNQLRKLAGVYKRPIAVFYLSKPPRDYQPMRDFRRFAGSNPVPLSPQLLYEIRRVQGRREVAIELSELIGVESPDLTIRATTLSDPESLALQIREYLEVRFDEQVQWRARYTAFNQWRAAIEGVGIPVFQIYGVAVEEIRGCSLNEGRFPAIVVNGKDSPNARIFSMLHEFAHIMLRQGGICDFSEESQVGPQEPEVFCNNVAGATLVPKDYLLEEDIVSRNKNHAQWDTEDLEVLAQKYGASQEVILRRLLTLGRTTRKFYQAQRSFWAKVYASSDRHTSKGGPPPHRKALNTAGLHFVRLVLANYYQDNITARDVSDFLEMRLKHLDKLEAVVSSAASS